jgi:transposase
MDKEKYRQILIHQMKPSALRLFPDGNYRFQQDNDPKHTAGTVKAYMENNGVPLMPWPAQSPDLNPIENLWSIVDGKMNGRECKNEAALYETVKTAWQDIPIDMLTRLVDSMPRRCQAVIDAKGYATKY